MSPTKLSHLIYTSAATPGFDANDLKSILKTARTKNASRSVTGMLLYTSGSFFQVLEGEEETLEELFVRISLDPRHRSITKIIQEPIAQLDFGDWTMGFSGGDPSEFKSIDGFNDFFRQGNSLANLEPGRAKKLLSAFSQGRWRTRLSGGTQ